MARTWRGSGGGRGRGRGRGRGGRHAGGRNGNNGNDIDAAGGHSTRSPRVLHGPTPHPWLGRRLRITRISHKGQRRYVNAVIVFHDPAESHPFHVLHDDGAHAWLAIQESQGVVHAVEGDSGGTTVGVRRKRISRKFVWLTQVLRRETVSNERGGAGGAPRVNGSHGRPNANSNALPAHPAPPPPKPHNVDVLQPKRTTVRRQHWQVHSQARRRDVWVPALAVTQSDVRPAPAREFWHEFECAKFHAS